MSLIKLCNQWPGGIPSYIRRHEQPEDDVISASRAWRHFVREQWTDSSYESRAPEDEPTFEDLEQDGCLYGIPDCWLYDVHICISEWTAVKQALLAKCVLALFPWDGSYEHLARNMPLWMPFEDNQGDILSTFKFRLSVAQPNFLDMHMAQDGTVLFLDTSPKLIIDDRTLETGLALWVQFATNGTTQRAYRSQMLIDGFPDLYREVHPNQDPLELVLEHMGEQEEHDNPQVIQEDESVDMRRPFAEVYLVGSYYGENGHERMKQELRDLVDQYAPGFREAEERGNGVAIGYDLQRILVDEGRPLWITEDPLN
ncbi:hypothetical protein PMG11_10345 [Penicillium brasilianum]|uniref:Uncharacterized protein n=1 Tax=Penicillium brasilianum TaxID=104259 RepID=A0A0F7TYX7_PENBI|nr:hypothetical protein PMG11_10345 [Penicillium brasilianum]